jgi:hypothetical protein
MGSRWGARLRRPWRSPSEGVLVAGAEPVPDEVSWDDAPGPGDRLHCLFCHSAYPASIHRLDEAAATFRDAAGAQYALPSFVAVCNGCDRLSAEGEHAVLAQLMRVQNPYEDEAGNIVATFHRARRESRPLAE